jgi:hypothetical protein
MARSSPTNDLLHVVDQAEITECPQGHAIRFPNPLPAETWSVLKRQLDKLGATWNRKLQASVAPKTLAFTTADAKNLLRRAASGQNVNGDSYFPTPDKLAADLAELLFSNDEIRAMRDMIAYLDENKEETHPLRILEPSAGDGALIRAVSDRLGDIPHHFYACEISPGRRDILQKMPNISLVGDDFLSHVPDRPYDRIIANPPFDRDLWAQHMLHAHSILNQNRGQLAFIGPTGGRTDAAIEIQARINLMGETTQHPAKSFSSGQFKAGVSTQEAQLHAFDTLSQDIIERALRGCEIAISNDYSMDIKITRPDREDLDEEDIPRLERLFTSERANLIGKIGAPWISSISSRDLAIYHCMGRYPSPAKQPIKMLIQADPSAVDRPLIFKMPDETPSIALSQSYKKQMAARQLSLF